MLNFEEFINENVVSFSDDDIDKISKTIDVHLEDPIFKDVVNRIRVPMRIYKGLDIDQVMDNLKELGYYVSDDYDNYQLIIKKKSGVSADGTRKL